jgi:hypothetical protein
MKAELKEKDDEYMSWLRERKRKIRFRLFMWKHDDTSRGKLQEKAKEKYFPSGGFVCVFAAMSNEEVR